MRLFTFLTLIFSILLISCDSNKQNAISFVKETKTPSDARFTWNDYALEWGKHFKEPFEWKAKNVDSLIQVSFVNNTEFGLYWMIDLSNNTCFFLDGRNAMSRKYGFQITVDSTTFPIQNVSTDLRYKTTGSEYANVIHETDAVVFDKPGIFVISEGAIKNNSGGDLTSWNLRGQIDIVYEDKMISENIMNLIVFKEDHKIWKNGESKRFKVRTKDVDTIYANYQPLYVDFSLSLKAEDPIGYLYDKHIYSHDLMGDWKNINAEKTNFNKGSNDDTDYNNSEPENNLPPVVLCNKELDSLERKHSLIYKKLYSSLDAKEQSVLKSSQLKWIKIRDKKCLGAQEEYAGGSMAGYIYCQCTLEETQKRIEVLKSGTYSEDY